MGASHNRGMGATGADEHGPRTADPNAVGAARVRSAALLLVFALCSACQSPVLRARQADADAAEQASLTGDWPRAAELWHAVHLSNGGSEVRPYYETARALLHVGDRDSACAMLDQGLLVFPEQPDLLELRARVLAESGFRRSAEECLGRVVALYPDRASALNALARVRMQLGLEHAAVAPLQALIRLTDGDAETYHLLADALRLTGKPVEAFAAYRQAIELGADQHDLLLQAAQLAISEAVREAEPEALVLAATWLRRVVEEDPQRTQAHFIRALLCEACDRPAEAIEHYRRAIELDLTFLDALTNLALLHASRGEVEATREMVDRALELEQHPGRRAALEAIVTSASEAAAEAQPTGDGE